MITYDQGKRERSKSYCRYFAHLTILSNLWNIELSDNDFHLFRDFTIHKSKVGGNPKEGCFTVEKRRNERFPECKVKGVCLRTKTAIRRHKLHRCGVSVSIARTEKFKKDYRDGSMDSLEEYTGKSKGHIISVHEIDGKLFFTNSWKTNNIIEIKNIDNPDLFKSTESFSYIKI